MLIYSVSNKLKNFTGSNMQVGKLNLDCRLNDVYAKIEKKQEFEISKKYLVVKKGCVSPCVKKQKQHSTSQFSMDAEPIDDMVEQTSTVLQT